MPIIPSRYPLDLTATNINNFVEGDIRQLDNRQVRCVAPQYGPYFTETLSIRDLSNARLLTRGLDYQCLDLNDVATLKSHKEVCSIVAIISPAVSSSISMSYHVIGGEYEKDHGAIVNLIEALTNDTRPVLWPNVLNRPDSFTPAPHLTTTADIYGFESLLVSIEAIRKVLLFGDQIHTDRVLDYLEKTLNEFNIQIRYLLDTYEKPRIDSAVAVSEQARVNAETALANAQSALATIENIRFQRDEINVLSRRLEQNAFDSEQKARALIRENIYLLR